MHPLVTAVEVIPPYRSRLTFEDGTTGTVDARSWVEQSPGVFAELRDPAAFAKVFVNGESGTIEWPNGGLQWGTYQESGGVNLPWELEGGR